MTRRRFLVLLPAACVVAALCGGAAAPEPAEEVRFCFVQITDTHFGDDDHAERTARAVEMINRLPMKVACVVHTGDVVEDRIADPNTVRAARKTLGRLRAPLHYLPGNHDISRLTPAEHAALYRKQFGPLCSRAEYHGVVFLMVYTEPPAKGFAVPGFDPLAWLEKALKAARGKPVIVFHHRPCVGDFYGNRVHPGWPAEARKRWVDLLNAHNVRAVLAGHFHRDEQYWLGRVPLYVSAPVAGYFGRQGSFRIYEYHNGRLSYRSQYIRMDR